MTCTINITFIDRTLKSFAKLFYHVFTISFFKYKSPDRRLFYFNILLINLLLDVCVADSDKLIRPIGYGQLGAKTMLFNTFDVLFGIPELVCCDTVFVCVDH